MKTTTTIAAVLAALLIPTGATQAQQWSGVAAIAASQGYSASTGMGMSVPVPAEPDATVADPAAASAAPAAPRLRAPRAAMASLAAGRGRDHRVRVARTVAPSRHRDAIVARAKRPLSRRHARIA